MFIVLDGIDGAGKGEQMIKLHNHLFVRSKNYRILTTREPTNGKYGKKIREILEKEDEPLKNADLLLDLYIKDRKEHLKNTINPFLSSAAESECNIVLCDRYYYSTIAFQYAQGIPMARLLNLNKDFRKPDIAFILDCPAETALARIAKRGAKEKFEKIEFMENVRHNFSKLKELLQDNIKIIDAAGSIEEVFRDIKEELDFKDPEWEKKLREWVKKDGRLHGYAGIDYFIFPKNLPHGLPAFPVGRPGWDNWFIDHIRRERIPVIDTTPVNLVVHQNHPSVYRKPEKKNENKKSIALAGGFLHMMTIRDADWLLTEDGLKRPEIKRRTLALLSLFYPWQALLAAKRYLERNFLGK